MATINDVAKKAGVSRGTVSNVINGLKVRDESRKKVEAAIKELGYIPNAAARSLKSNRTHTVALILPTIWFPFFSKLTNDIEEALHAHGYKLLLCNSHNDWQREINYIQMAQENKVDGILFITYSDITPYIKDADIPMVAIERYFSQNIPFISTDNFLGGTMAAEKLTQLGAKRLLFVGRKAERNEVSEQRRQGFESWCREHRIAFDEFFPECPSEDFYKALEEKVKSSARDGLAYDGIFTAVDRYAEVIIKTLEETEPAYKAGRDYQIIGFDGVPAYKNGQCDISSIAQPVKALAEQSVEMLVAQIEGKRPEQYVLLAPEFLQGKSTKKI